MGSDKKTAHALAEIEQAAKNASDAVPDYQRQPKSVVPQGSTALTFSDAAVA